MRFWRDKRGATAIEYGLIASLISVAAIAGFTGTGQGVKTQLCHTAGKMGEAGHFEVPGCGGAPVDEPPPSEIGYGAGDADCPYKYNYASGVYDLDTNLMSGARSCESNQAISLGFPGAPQDKIDLWKNHPGVTYNEYGTRTG